MTFVDCIFSSNRFDNGCAAMRDDVKCDPDTCMWRHTEKTFFESLDKAALNYKKRTGRDDYIQTQKALPQALKKRYLIYRALKDARDVLNPNV